MEHILGESTAFLEHAWFHCSFNSAVILGLDFLCEKEEMTKWDSRNRGVRCNGDRTFHKYLFAGYLNRDSIHVRSCPRQEQMSPVRVNRANYLQRVKKEAC